MRWRFCKSIVFLCFLAFPCGRLYAQATWVGTAADENWSTSGNWSGGVVPTEFNLLNVIFNAGTANYPIQSSGANAAYANNLTFQGTSASVTIGPFTETVSNAGGFTIEDSITVGAGTYTILGTTAMQAPSITFSANGSLAFSGTSGPITGLNYPSMSTAIFGADTPITGPGTIVFGGNNYWQGGGNLQLDTVVLEIDSTGAFGEINPTMTYTAASAIWMTDSVLEIAIDNFSIQAVPVQLYSSEEIIIANGYVASIASVISQGGSLNKSGEGTLNLRNNSNSYSGGTLISAGTLNITNNGQLGSATSTLTIEEGAILQAGATFSLTDGMGHAKTIALSGSAIIDTNGYNLTVPGIIEDDGMNSGGFEKKGSGILYLQNSGMTSNSYSGDTIIRAGTLNITNAEQLGLSTSLTIKGGATLQAGGVVELPSSVEVSLGSGHATIDSSTFACEIEGEISGSGALYVTGSSGSWTLSHSNSYSGGTTVTGVGETLIISQDQNLGHTSGILTMNGGTILQAGATFSLSSERSVMLQGNVTINSGGYTFTIEGPIQDSTSGSGLLTKSGAGTLILSGDNSYSGGTTITQGILRGTTSSLQRNIFIQSGELHFNQSTSGTYAGSITGSGTLKILGTGGTVTMTGNSSTYSGPTTVSGTNTKLIVDGTLASSTITVSADSYLMGSGTVSTSGGTTINGTISPGASGNGTLQVNGAGGLTFGAGGILAVEVNSTTSGLVEVAQGATLTGGFVDVLVDVQSGLFSHSNTYTILTMGSRTGTFSLPITISDPNYIATLLYPSSTEVQLVLQSIRPFLYFPCGNFNECAVAHNIDALNAAGTLTSGLTEIVDSFAGQSNEVINEALDQMHPAALSAFAELQTELGGQLLSLFHRGLKLRCGCFKKNRVWIEPFGNWLKEKKQGEEIGFHATTVGIAAGYDRQFFDCITIGLGGACNRSDLQWSQDRGYAYIDGAYGVIYSDLEINHFYLGASLYAGKDWYETIRHLKFTAVDKQAKSHSHGFDMGGQLTAAYFFGPPHCLLYPYATADFLYLDNASFSESGADSLDLNVDRYTSSTLRAEGGGALQFIDKNRDGTICISPLFSIGYVLELPLRRDHFHSTFSGESISFITKGWNMAWQLLNLRFGLGITYKCVTLDSQYIADISPEGGSPFVNQRANFRLSYNF